MKLSTFVCLILVMLAGWMQFYAKVRESFNGLSEYKAEIARLSKRNEEEHLAMALNQEQFLEFRQNVATLMPDVLKQKGLGEEGYAYRNLASTVTRNEATEIRQAIAKTLFERAKTHFRNKEYAKAMRLFKQISDNYSFTPYVAECYFLRSEAHFQLNEFEESTALIQQMVELFPHHELTGFALVRLGRIYEAQNRNEEAIDIYKTVLRSYPQRDVASQAKKSLRGLDL